MNRRHFLRVAPGALFASHSLLRAAVAPKKGIMLLDRIGPTTSELYIANADGSGERKLLQSPAFDFHASFSRDGQSILFTSERRGRGQADLYMARIDGTEIRPLTSDPAADDVGVLSPDGSRVAFVSTRGTHKANIWILDLKSGALKNLTGSAGLQGDPSKPDGFFRPAWSPDGRWIAFSSDRNTEWTGHACDVPSTPSNACPDNSDGWEHVQELSIYIVGADGQGLRRVAGQPGRAVGSPKWSPDGRRIVFYEMPVLDTWNARVSYLLAMVSSQIVSVDVSTGERVEHTSGPGLKLFPQYLNATEIAYQVKAPANGKGKGPAEGLYLTSGKLLINAILRSPCWSPDGTKLIYEKTSWTPLPQNTLLYSWDPTHEYRYSDIFPRLSKDGKLVLTEHSVNSTIAIMDPDGSNRQRIFAGKDGAAFEPCWSPDGQWIVFGYGSWFENRMTKPAKLMRVRRDGSGLETLLEGPFNAGFPSFAPDGKRIVFRLWSDKGAGGLHIFNLADRSVKELTTEFDNLPDWSPDGSRIVFTRRLSDGNFDIFTIRPDGSDVRRLTTSGANDAHAVWTADGRLLWNSGAYGFKDEAALYDNSFQPYGQIWIMNADGSGKRVLTDSLWEDGQPLYIENLRKPSAPSRKSS